MAPLEVAVVSRDPDVRLAAAAAFDAAPVEWRVDLYERVPAGADVVVLGPGEPGAGVRFDPSRPAAVVGDVERALHSRSHLTVTVTSPSGGTGTTSVALHLAASLAGRAGTCLVELDARCGVGARLALGDETRTWADLAEDAAAAARCALPTRGGFRVLLAPPTPEESVDPVECARARWGTVVVEARSEDLHAALSQSDAAIAVIAPTVVGAARGRRLLAGHPDVPWAVVSNRLGPGGETTKSALEHLLERPIALELPCCAALRDAEDQGRLLASPLYRWRRRIDRLARALAP